MRNQVPGCILQIPQYLKQSEVPSPILANISAPFGEAGSWIFLILQKQDAVQWDEMWNTNG